MKNASNNRYNGESGCSKSDECHSLLCPQRTLKMNFLCIPSLRKLLFSQIKITVIILPKFRLMLFWWRVSSLFLCPRSGSVCICFLAFILLWGLPLLGWMVWSHFQQFHWFKCLSGQEENIISQVWSSGYKYTSTTTVACKTKQQVWVLCICLVNLANTVLYDYVFFLPAKGIYFICLQIGA